MRAPVFGHGQLRLYLLSLLAERPMHGYELIQALSDRFGGTYAPSAGTVYPRLQRLQQEGLVAASSDGRRTVHAITTAGREELDARREELTALQVDVDDSVQRLADGVRASVDQAMRSLRADLAASARRAPSEPDRAPSGRDDTARARRQAEEAGDALARFRQDLRTDLRSAAATGRLGPEVVPVLIERLDAVRAEIARMLADPGTGD